MPNDTKIMTRMVGDTETPITATLTRDGSPVSLVGKTVKFVMRANDNTLVVDAAATVVSASAGTVAYDFQDADVEDAGTYFGWWVVTTTATDKVEHFPHDGRKLRIVLVDEEET